MAGTSHIHPFAVGSGANTLTQAAWEALMAVPGGGVPTSGFLDGIASATQINTVLRQVSVVAAALAGFVVDVAAVDVNDDGNVSAFESSFRDALDALYVPLDTLNSYVQTAAFIGANQLLSTNGYQRLPGGYIEMWGVHTNTSDSEIVTFPTMTGASQSGFPTACFNVSMTLNEANGASSQNIGATNPTRTGFTAFAGGQERPFFWRAIGH
jgi:hypothetical protein